MHVCRHADNRPPYRAIPLLFSTSDWPQNNTLGDNNDLGLAALSPPQPPTQALTFLIASVKDGWGGDQGGTQHPIHCSLNHAVF